MDPDLPAIRKRAVKALSADFGALLVPAGYKAANQQKTLWVRKGWAMTSWVHIQKSANGGGCYINVGYERPFHGGPVPSWEAGTNIRLPQLSDDPDAISELGLHRYHLLQGDSAMRAALVALLKDRGLPLLARIHGLQSYRAQDEFRPWLKAHEPPTG